MEQIEYLLTRVPKTDSRKHFEKHSLEHVLSFQRRVHASKRFFLKRGKVTPLGVVEDLVAIFSMAFLLLMQLMLRQDYWDRTEASPLGGRRLQ